MLNIQSGVAAHQVSQALLSNSIPVQAGAPPLVAQALLPVRFP
jgi:hypothetical protein